jgi:carbon monoxide dehydrogenase subunit G
MLLEHKFTVPVPPGEAWVVLLDLERVAPCMPGATLESVDGDEFTGKVKVKVGPITVTYTGKGKITERDESAHRAVIEASGRETRGSGTASATITATLEPRGEGDTEVAVSTDLAITGKPAQFGRGVMNEVGAKLIGIFAECLAGKITAGDELPVRKQHRFQRPPNSPVINQPPPGRSRRRATSV